MAEAQQNMGLPFMKMHGLGNDFVVVDNRACDHDMTAKLARALGDRHRGVGFDQLAVISSDATADAALLFYNADGSTSAACGNATRCIARFLMDETGANAVQLRTERGLLAGRRADGDMTSVNMGPPVLDWRSIPLAKAVDIDRLPIDGEPMATGMGNPHCSFFVDDADRVELETEGPKFERHPLFPERTNVQFAHVVGTDHLRMRVWERGAGVTLASGSSSCAVAVAAVRRGLTGRKLRIELDGGTIHINWSDDGVWMTGPTTRVFDGTLSPDYLADLG